jgi:outer membrane receptor protein involved in Fe transport
MIDHVEVRAIEQVSDRLRVEAAPFYKHTTGTIIQDPTTKLLTNLNATDFWGFDLIARARVQAMVELGGAWDYVRDREEATATTMAVDDLIPRLPHHRVEGWVQVTPERRIALLARVRYFGSSNSNGAPLPAYTLVEATATAQLTRGFLAVLRVDDLLNARPEINVISGVAFHAPGRVVTLLVQGQWE